MILQKKLMGFIIADLFGTHESTISRTFTTWIHFLASVLKPLIKWLTKKKVMKHMPRSFRNKYGNTRAVIDCTESFVQRPSRTVAQYSTELTRPIKVIIL